MSAPPCAGGCSNRSLHSWPALPGRLCSSWSGAPQTGTIGVLGKIGAEAADVRGIDVRHIVGHPVAPLPQGVGVTVMESPCSDRTCLLLSPYRRNGRQTSPPRAHHLAVCPADRPPAGGSAAGGVADVGSDVR